MHRMNNIWQRSLKSKLLRCSSAAALLFAAATECRAVDRFWDTFLGGTFNDPINWQGSTVPGPNDVAHFGLTTNPVLAQRAYTVGFSADRTNQALKVEDDFVTFDLNGRVYTTTLVTGNEIGNVAGRSGRLTITDGTMVTGFSSDLSIGAVANGSGSLTVSSGGLLIGLPFLLVGRVGTGTLTVENNGDILTDETHIGNNAGAVGTATITGGGSSLGADFLTVGNQGSGTLNITAGGRVENNDGRVGNLPGSIGVANVEGTNSQWLNSGDLFVGERGSGTLNIRAGGRVQSAGGAIGLNGTGAAAVEGPASQWISTGGMSVGNIGDGTLSITAGGRVENTFGVIGGSTSSDSEVTVSGANSLWKNSSGLRVGIFGEGALKIMDGGTVQSASGELGGGDGGGGTVTVSGAGSRWTNSGLLTIGNVSKGTLNITAGGLVENTIGVIGSEPGSIGNFVTVSGTDSRWLNSGELRVGFGIASGGILNIAAGGMVQSTNGVLGSEPGSVGTVTLDGVNSRWTNSGTLTVGNSGNGFLNVTAGAVVNVSGAAVVGKLAVVGSFPGGVLTVNGAGSALNGTSLTIGASSSGTLKIQNGGSVTTTSALIGFAQLPNTGSTGVVTVEGAGSTWTNSGNLLIGGNRNNILGQGTLNINPGGTVTVGNILSPNRDGAVNLNGGELNVFEVNFRNDFTFTFNGGTLRFTSDAAIEDFLLDRVLGPARTITSLKHLAIVDTATLLTPVILDGGTFSAGQLINSQLLHLQRGTLNLTNQAVTVQTGGLLGDTLDLGSDTTVNVTLGISNRGLVTGDGRLSGPFHNDTDGELRAEPGRSLTLTGANNINDGQIHLFGGLLELTQDLTNNAGALVSGAGTLVVGSGLLNRGVMNFSGPTNIAGDATNAATGTIISSGGGPLTFFDDVVNNGEIRTSLGSFTVFFGSLSGNGPFTGAGTIVLEGDLKPGSSPGEAHFEGGLAMGNGALLEMELATGIHDRLVVTGDLSLAGDLQVRLLDGFSPSEGDRFDLIDFGRLEGSFEQILLPELGGGLSWDASGLYDQGILAVVPEPSAMMVIAAMLPLGLRRRRILR